MQAEAQLLAHEVAHILSKNAYTPPSLDPDAWWSSEDCAWYMRMSRGTFYNKKSKDFKGFPAHRVGKGGEKLWRAGDVMTFYKRWMGS